MYVQFHPREGHVRLIMQISLTLIGVGVGLFIVLAGGYSSEIENWASGLIGLVVGFWLK